MGLTLASIAALYAMWLGYVFAMHIINRWDALPLPSKVLGALPAVLVYVADVILNWTVVTLLFFDLPRERTITDRLHRYQATPGRRAQLSRWVCQYLLNPFDADHC